MDFWFRAWRGEAAQNAETPVSILIGCLILGGGVIRAIFDTRNPYQHLLFLLPGPRPLLSSLASNPLPQPSNQVKCHLHLHEPFWFSSSVFFFGLFFPSTRTSHILWDSPYPNLHAIHFIPQCLALLLDPRQCSDVAERKKKRMNECRLNFYLFWLCWVFVAVKGLCYPEAYTILVPQPGMGPASPTLEVLYP